MKAVLTKTRAPCYYASMGGNGGTIVVVGGANIDIQGRPKAAFLAGDSNPGLISRSFGGVGHNIAENLALLEMNVELVTVVGRDPEGEAMLEDCRAKGVGISHCLRSKVPSPSYLCIVDESGGLVGAVADMSAMEELVPARFEALRSLFAEADYIVADANVPEDSLRWIAGTFGRQARSGVGPRLYLDPVSRAKAGKILGITASFDCVKPNRREALLLAGVEEGDPAALSRAMSERGRLPGELFISLGAEGMFYRTTDSLGIVALPGLAGGYPVVNRSGAGDAACAALLWGEAQGFDAESRAEFALVAAMLTASCPEPVHQSMGDEELRLVRHELFHKETDQ